MKPRSVVVLITLLISIGAFAQTTPQQPAAQKATIQGTVIRAGAGQPLKRARVSLRRSGNGQGGQTGQVQGVLGGNAEVRLNEIRTTLESVGGGAQIAQVQERLQTVMTAAQTQAVTDDSGRFMFTGVEPGDYRISVEREGYIRQEYGQRSFNSPGTIVSVAGAQRVTNIDFQMIPGGSISGRIFNEEGEPIANASVQAQTYTYQQGRRVLAPTGQGAQTNDLGEFRLFWLSPGDYYISATRRGMLAAANPVVAQQTVTAQRGQQAAPGGRGANRGGPNPTPVAGGAPQNEQTYAPTYFPGTVNPESAGAIALTAGGEVRGVEFGIRPTPTVSVRGQVIVPVSSTPAAQTTPAPQPAPGMRGGIGPRGGGPGGRPQINVMLTRTGSGRFWFGGQNRTNVRQDGTFDISGVVPGSYNLTVVARQDGQQFSSRMKLDVADNGVDNLTIALRPGTAIPGKIFLDGTPPSEFRMNQLRVNLMPFEDMGGGGIGPMNAQVGEDGTFTIPNVPSLEYRVRVAGLPQGAYVMAGRIGSDDAVNQPFSVSGDQVVLQLQIGFLAGQVRGTVVDSRGSAYQGAMVTLVPDDPRRLRTELYFSTPTDQYGRFNFATVPPGGYKVFAWEEIPNGAYMDPEYIRRFEERGRPVKVDPAAAVDSQVPVITAQN